MSKKIKTKKDVLFAIGGAIIVLILLDLTPLGGNTVAYYNYLNCNRNLYQVPLVSYRKLPHYVESSMAPAVLRGYPTYFCSPEDAERAGYSADPESYSFPHLPKAEFEDALNASKKIYN